MKNVISLLVLFFILNSCSPGDDTQYSYRLIPIESVEIPTEFTLGETYPITVHYTLPTSCYHFSSLYYDKNLNIRTIAVETLVETRNNCQELSAVDGARTETFNFYVTSNGTYIFKFYQGKDDQGNDIFLEYEVPVTH
ncbi:hypothetical protein L1S35_08580 [Flavobacterium sp. AS60]|uniref:hypothetical protein n=1 Tax=Flavobacterium anseongense TaxID=2910677 RepID=UPI001F2E080C|nr:hypothetical protein [Flavobacterium sp. AS60]MCF6129727.1 hypothetical protein [Flavobacterium sp. AS60]